MSDECLMTLETVFPFYVVYQAVMRKFTLAGKRMLGFISYYLFPTISSSISRSQPGGLNESTIWGKIVDYFGENSRLFRGWESGDILEHADDGLELELDVIDDSGGGAVGAVEALADVGLLLIGDDIADKLREGLLGGGGRDEPQLDECPVEVMPPPSLVLADEGVELVGLGHVDTDVASHAAEGGHEEGRGGVVAAEAGGEEGWQLGCRRG